jgi:predicted Fe-Mo cluster-binding NifX family protein
MDPRFGRCPYFLFVETNTMKFKAVENPNVGAMGGAGIQSAQLVANKGAEAVLTGSCGPNAFQTLQAAQVKVIVGVVGSIKDAIERYKSGQLRPAAKPNVQSHFGTGSGQSMDTGSGGGMGGGMGWGMGRRRGRGMGGGWGQQMAYPPQQMSMIPPQPPGVVPTQATAEQELQAFKQHAEFLRQQIEGISRRIAELEKRK